MDIFIHQDAGKRLEDFSELIFSLFKIEIKEERDSSNYPPNERYFVGYGKLKNIKLWDEDSEMISGFPFILSLEENTYKCGDCVLPEDIEEIAETLRLGGLKCFVPVGDYWKMDWKKEGKMFLPDIIN